MVLWGERTNSMRCCLSRHRLLFPHEKATKSIWSCAAKVLGQSEELAEAALAAPEDNTVLRPYSPPAFLPQLSWAPFRTE